MTGTGRVYEVEMKFRVWDAAAAEARLRSLGATGGRILSQLDRYFSHPCRDFAVTDEALRLRRVGDQLEITYKGPRLDAATKTRRECSLPLGVAAGAGAAGSAETWTELLTALGFRAVAEVAKHRIVLSIVRGQRVVEIAIDTVAGLGTYVEIELLAEADGLAAARECVASLACEAGLGESERRSYLELLLAARGGSPETLTPQ